MLHGVALPSVAVEVATPGPKSRGYPAAAFLTRKLMQNFEDPYPQGGAKKSGRANQNGLFFPLQPWL
jgi:hypothetical protein